MDKTAKLLALGFTEDEIIRLFDKVDVEAGGGDIQPDCPRPVAPQPTANVIDFVHLHNHTDYSMLDGMCRIDGLISRAVELGMPAVAMTDHGNISGAVQFHQTAKDSGIKSTLVGCEMCYVPDMSEKTDREMWHLVLLAKDETGYKNLVKITSAGYLEGFYHKPRVDMDYISAHSDGLIALTACIAGSVPGLILIDRMDEAREELGRLKDVFGRDFYVEIMDHGMDEQKRVNPELIRLAGEFGVPIVATNDCHYVAADDAFAHDALLCIQTKKTLADADRFRFSSDQFFFKSQDEMARLFPEEYLTRTLEVAGKCNLELDLSSKMPEFVTPDGSTAEDYLWQRIQQGARERYGTEIDTVRQERIQREFEVISKTGFAGYFLIIEDMVQFARQRGIRIGAGRGSAVASLICYTLGITGVDPVTHNLLSERSLTEDRVSPPDIDIDFQHDRRGEITEYLNGKYGDASLITTFTRFRPRSAVRYVGDILGVGAAKIDTVAKKIPQHTEKKLEELQHEIPELSEMDPRLIDLCDRLHGVIRGPGKHPAGVVVSSTSLTKLIPLGRSKSGDAITQFDKDSLEAAGMLKTDALGSKMLTVVDMTLDQIEQRCGTELSDYPPDDPMTYESISSGDVDGIFQLGERWGGDLSRRMQPRCFSDLVHILALGRPGVLDAGLVDRYFQAREAGKIEYLHPDLEPILSDTYGVILFQEQIMQIAIKLAGFSPSDSDKLREATGKKDDALMASMAKQFMDGCADRGIQKETGEELWTQIQYFGGYGFNKAHSVGYAFHTYETAYLKTHYPVEYFASLLSVAEEDSSKKMDKRGRYIADARRRSIRVAPPDINFSTDRYAIADDAICLPLTAVQRVGPSACAAIVETRESGEFDSYEDFCERVPKRAVNKRVKENLVKAGAFDGDRCIAFEPIPAFKRSAKAPNLPF